MSLFDQLNQDYLRLHTAKEEAFWANKMGLKDYAEGSFEAREIELRKWMADPKHLPPLRKELGRPNLSESERLGLEGWQRFFEVNVIENPHAQHLQEKLIEAEGQLGLRRNQIKLGYHAPDTGEFVPSSYGALSLMVSTAADEKLRKAAWQGMAAIGPYVIEQGFLEVVKQRNELARTLGYEDYYDYKVQLTEGFSKKTLFTILDDLEKNTQKACQESVDAVATRCGPAAKEPWNFGFFTSGNIKIKMDPYFSFTSALERWGESFAALGIKYSGATLQLDLLNRPGKYENGFMHGPGPAWIEHGRFRPARINFTANAIPGAVGSGLEALLTLFHEGGHAAHFSNIRMPAPCFSQEFAPTSVAFAETQSMFLDGIIHEPSWLCRYARNEAGETMPLEMIKEVLLNEYQYRAKMLRSILCVSYCEKALYEMSDQELTPAHVLETVRRIEQRLHCQAASPRPVLSVPHLLSGESSAYYHGYVLAEMAVYQTRAYFMQKYGYVTDNPEVGPELQKMYWQPGNAKTFLEFIKDLSGEAFSAKATIELVNKPMNEVYKEAENAVAKAQAKPRALAKIQLDAKIQMVHGDEVIAASDEKVSFKEMSETFGRWVEKRQSAVSQPA